MLVRVRPQLLLTNVYRYTAVELWKAKVQGLMLVGMPDIVKVVAEPVGSAGLNVNSVDQPASSEESVPYSWPL
jgi:hypothetical protein